MIASPGIGSGLDINSLVNQLVSAEGQPKSTRLASLEANTQAKISAFGLLKSSLSALSASIDDLKLASTFNGRAANSGDSSLFTVAAGDGAAIASYSFEVTSLASPQKLISAGFSSTSTVVGSGTITITSGSQSTEVVVPSGTDTLLDVRDAINVLSEQSGVTASILTVDDGMGGSEEKLLFSANSPGSANNISVTVDDDDLTDTDTAGLSRLVYDPDGSGTTNLSVASPATDAVFKIDNQTVTRSSNTISDAVEGLTLTLVKADVGNPTTLTVSRDAGASKAAVKDFVIKFNALQNNVAELTKFDAETGQAGVLLGNSALLTLSNQIRRELTDSVLGSDQSLRTLSDLGVSTQLDGTLDMDESKLDTALADNHDGVVKLFTSFDGIAIKLDTAVDGILRSGGTIQASLDGLETTLDDIADQREALDRSLLSLEARLFAQFNAMDALVAQLSSTSNFLTQQLTAVEAIVNGNNS